MAFTESRFNFNVKHPTRDLYGIGGIKKVHGIKNPNSLLAIEQVWMKYMKLNNNDFHKSIKDYKGTIRNFKSYYLTLNAYNKIKHIQNKK